MSLAPAELEEVPGGLKANVWLVSTTVAVLVTAIYTWARVLPFMLRERGADDFQVSLSYTLTSLAVNLLQYPGGVMADRQGRKFWVVMPTLGVGALYLTVFFTPGWAALVAVLVAVNCLNAVQSPGFVALLAESVAPAERGRAFALLQLFVGLSVAAGPALGAVLLPLVGADVLVMGTGVLFLICGAVRQARLRETLRPAPAGPEAGRSWSGLKRLWVLLAVSTAYQAVSNLTVWGPFMALYLADVMGYTPRQVNLLFALGPLVAVAFSTFSGRIVDRLGSRRVLGLACLAHVLALGGWLLTRSLGPCVLLLVPVFGSAQLGVIAFDTLRSEMAGDRERGRVLGILGTGAGTVAALAPAAAGVLAWRWGPLAPFGLAGAAGLGGFGLLQVLRRTAPERAPGAGVPAAQGVAGAGGPAAAGGEEGRAVVEGGKGLSLPPPPGQPGEPPAQDPGREGDGGSGAR